MWISREDGNRCAVIRGEWTTPKSFVVSLAILEFSKCLPYRETVRFAIGHSIAVETRTIFLNVRKWWPKSDPFTMLWWNACQVRVNSLAAVHLTIILCHLKWAQITSPSITIITTIITIAIIITTMHHHHHHHNYHHNYIYIYIYMYRILQAGTKIWILSSSSGENNILRMRKAIE